SRVLYFDEHSKSSFFGTLLNVPGKTKYGLNERLVLGSMRIKKGLEPIKKENIHFYPQNLYFFLHGVKVREGYYSNIRNLVSIKDLKLKDLKCHDCHVLMEHFLPIAIRSILPKNAICCKVIDPKKLSTLQRHIILSLCELEMYFPPSFFHIIHSSCSRDTICGPSYMRWMYHFEQVLKLYIAYLLDVDFIGIPKSHYAKRTFGDEIIGKQILSSSRT
ncbi:hypothetical protein Lal_00042485, partial [Lupinus albus]